MDNSKRNDAWCVNIKTDSLSGRNPLDYDHHRDRKLISRRLRNAGVNPESGHYIGQLARFPGDPEAVVSSRSEIKALLNRRGWGAEGFIDVERRAPEPKLKPNE